ncbi:MAG: spermidine/putrescine ABC transporter substrate-binding protein PotF, partial [Natronospirillum sp.]
MKTTHYTAISMAVVAALGVSGSVLAQGQVNVFNWSDYVADDTIANFEERTGIDVVYDVYDSN